MSSSSSTSTSTETYFLRLVGALLTHRVLSYGNAPTPNTSQTIVSFWLSAIPSEFPLHFLALQVAALARGTFDVASLGHLFLRDSSLRHIIQALGTTAALASADPLLSMLQAQITSRDVFRRALQEEHIPTTLLNRNLSVRRFLTCAFPFPQLLMRNIEVVPAVVYGTAPAKVTTATANEEAANVFGHSVVSLPATATKTTAVVRERTLKLDIYWHKVRLRRRTGDNNTKSSSSSSSLAPVFMYIHGGGWVTGHRSYHSIPLLLEVARAGWLVVTINYRLAGGGIAPPFPYSLYDCKQAVGWLRQNAPKFGGDPSFIVCGGESAGGHLSLMMGLTPNVPAYQQKGMQDIDTHVDGVLDLYGVTDWTDSNKQWTNTGANFWNFLEKLIVKKKYADHTHEFVRGSPLWWVRGKDVPEALQRKNIHVLRPEEISTWVSRSSGSSSSSSKPRQTNNEQTGQQDDDNDDAILVVQNPAEARKKYSTSTAASSTSTSTSTSSSSSSSSSPNNISPLIQDMCVDRPVPPIMIVHGDVDTLVPVAESRLFYRALQERRARDKGSSNSSDKRAPAPDVYAEIPHAHHAFNFMISPRTLAMGDAVVDWLEAVYKGTMEKRRSTEETRTNASNNKKPAPNATTLKFRNAKL